MTAPEEYEKLNIKNWAQFQGTINSNVDNNQQKQLRNIWTDLHKIKIGIQKL